MTPENPAVTRYCSNCGQPVAADQLARFGDALVCPACKDIYAQKLREGLPAPAAAGRYRFAGFWIRVLASLIDSIILGVVNSILQFTVIGSMLGPINSPPSDAASAFAFAGAMGTLGLLGLVIGCAYEAIFVAQLGATPGKLALSMKVVRPDGSRVDLGRAAGRYFAKLLSMLILGIGYIMVAFDDEKRGLHDMICDTRVVRQSN